MAQARSRAIATRTSSAPAGLRQADQARPIAARSVAVGQEGSPRQRRQAHNFEAGGSESSTRFGSASALSRAPAAVGCGARTPPALDKEDFVQGGVELPPAPDASDDDEVRRLSVDQGEQHPQPAEPLPAPHEGALREFWPPGDGPRALFLDYDGTLREFESRPELAVPTQELSDLLSAIDAREDLIAHIISGRDAEFLASHFGSLTSFTLIAEHGFQIWRPGTQGFEVMDKDLVNERDDEAWKSVIRTEMASFVKSCPDSFIEEKASALVWHYRRLQDEASAEAAALDAVERLERVKVTRGLSKIRISHGHKVVEVSYRNVRKGPVMRRICEEKAVFGAPFVSVLVAGDDTSDESMFGIAPSDFLTIKVGRDATHAKFRVDAPADLRRFLWQLVNL